MTDDDLDGIDLHAWRVPPPAPVRTIAAPPVAPPKSRARWWIAGLAAANVALAATVAVLLVERPATVTVTAPAGGGDEALREHIRALEERQRALQASVDRLTETLRTTGPTDELDPDIVDLGMAKLAPRVRACGERTTVAGVVTATVDVSPRGRADRVRIQNAPDRALGDCVLSVFDGATFTPTPRGGTFTRTFRFGATP